MIKKFENFNQEPEEEFYENGQKNMKNGI